MKNLYHFQRHEITAMVLVSLDKVLQYCRSEEAAENNMKIVMENPSKEIIQRNQINNKSKKQMHQTQMYKKTDRNGEPRFI
jgi:hypothetical protein